MPEFHSVRKPAVGVLLLVINLVFFYTAPFRVNAAVVAQPTRVLIIFDVSKSMAASYETVTRMDAAKKLENNIIDSLYGRTNL